MNGRDIIIDIVNKIPGIRYKELQRVIMMPNGTLSYYIDMLMRDGAVIVRRDACSTRLFPIGMDEHITEIISLLKDNTRLKIVKYLLKHRSATYQELQKAVSKSSSTLAWHLDKLISAGIVIVKNTIGMNEYYIRDPELIDDIVKKHLDVIDNFVDLWSKL